jgi:hypothetical protein
MAIDWGHHGPYGKDPHYEDITMPMHASFLTFAEFSLIAMFAAKLAYQAELDPDEGYIGILVRDRGGDPAFAGQKAPWIELSVGNKRYAFWRHTMDLYEVGPDGAVADEPIHRNERSVDGG